MRRDARWPRRQRRECRRSEGTGAVCTDEACQDDLFCNAEERCRPNDLVADAEGCVSGTAPCARECDETSRCAAGCDVDGGGHDAIECGGDDCDDDDAVRVGFYDFRVGVTGLTQDLALSGASVERLRACA